MPQKVFYLCIPVAIFCVFLFTENCADLISDYSFTIDIIKEQSEYLKKVSFSTIEKDGFQTFPPRAFGSVQGTFFSLFTIDEIIDNEKIKKKYSTHGI